MKNHNVLLDHLIKRMRLRHDAALARAIGADRGIISKLRAGTRGLGPMIIARMSQASGMTVASIMAMAVTLTSADLAANRARGHARAGARRFHAAAAVHA